MWLQWCIHTFEKNDNSCRTSAAATAANNSNKKVILKSCDPFTDCISEINNTQVINAKALDFLIPICQYIMKKNTVIIIQKHCGYLMVTIYDYVIEMNWL